MLLKVSEKTNANGWRRQLTIDFENKTIKAGAFQFHSGDVESLTHKQYQDLMLFFTLNGFTIAEG